MTNPTYVTMDELQKITDEILKDAAVQVSIFINKVFLRWV